MNYKLNSGVNWTVDYDPTKLPAEWYRFSLGENCTVKIDFYGRKPTQRDIEVLRDYLAVMLQACGQEQE